MKFAATFSVVIFSVLTVFGQGKPAYQIFNAQGKKVSYKKMMKALGEKDILLFGEYHNNPIVHWLQLEVTKELGETKKLTLGAEMIEADNQKDLDRYLAGEIDEEAYDTLVRLWPNYYTDYAPLVEYAKTNKLKFVAANVPRRYASMVYKGGFEALDELPEDEKAWIAPLPIKYDPSLPGYTKMIEMMGGHGGENLPKAQALKDATMAHFILAYYKAGEMLIHYNGAFHSDFYDGIIWYLKQAKPDLQYGSISTASQKDLSTLEKEYIGSADFIICVDEDMTTTH